MISLLDFIVLFTWREKRNIYNISHFETILNKNEPMKLCNYALKQVIYRNVYWRLTSFQKLQLYKMK